MTRFSDLALAAGRVATGALGWSAEQFWRSTAAELTLALQGRIGPGEPAPLGRQDMEKLERGAGHGR